MNDCGIQGCTKKHVARGFCSLHYQKYRYAGVFIPNKKGSKKNRQMISKSLRGTKQSKKTIEKRIRSVKEFYKKHPNARKNISEHNKGRKFSEETRKKYLMPPLNK